MWTELLAIAMAVAAIAIAAYHQGRLDEQERGITEADVDAARHRHPSSLR